MPERLRVFHIDDDGIWSNWIKESLCKEGHVVLPRRLNPVEIFSQIDSLILEQKVSLQNYEAARFVAEQMEIEIPLFPRIVLLLDKHLAGQSRRMIAHLYRGRYPIIDDVMSALSEGADVYDDGDMGTFYLLYNRLRAKELDCLPLYAIGTSTTTFRTNALELQPDDHMTKRRVSPLKFGSVLSSIPAEKMLAQS